MQTREHADLLLSVRDDIRFVSFILCLIGSAVTVWCVSCRVCVKKY